ncbi:MAG: twin-arginine translocase subunit TatC [Desulfurococcales archaeon]|nr:twin-arginine translocase subunit TatC [Desulfurococcales archaeon]
MNELRRERFEDGIPPHDKEKPIMDHLVELSIRLRRIFIAVIVTAGVLSFIPVDFKYYIPLVSYFPNAVISYVLPKTVTWHGKTFAVHIAQYNPFAGFNLLIKTALLLGLLGASPVIAHEIYAYVEPALYPNEKARIKSLAIASIGLFLAGIAIAFFIVLPFAFKIMIVTSAAVVGSNTLIAFSDVEQLFSTIVLIALATGVAFEVPLIIYLLVSFNIVEEGWFVGENKKYIFILSMFLGAAISPDPSGVGMVVIGTAMFATIMLAAKLGAKHKRRGNDGMPIPAEVIPSEPVVFQDHQDQKEDV